MIDNAIPKSVDLKTSNSKRSITIEVILLLCIDIQINNIHIYQCFYITLTTLYINVDGQTQFCFSNGIHFYDTFYGVIVSQYKLFNFVINQALNVVLEQHNCYKIRRLNQSRPDMLRYDDLVQFSFQSFRRSTASSGI